MLIQRAVVVIRAALLVVLGAVPLGLWGIPLAAQEPEPHRGHEEPARTWTWTWTKDANVFFGVNLQDRHFTDFTAWESQNWFMLSGERRAGAGRLALHGMASLEPFTIEKQGSPQVFQTGEAYEGGPLIDRQHPHDLVMDLGITYTIERGPLAYMLAAALVGAPALGPPPFMHRESGRDNPQAPLGHHHMDATHITPGVVTAGVEAAGASLEGSWFRGEEPDDNRLTIDRPRFNSWSARGRWRRGPWDAQISGGHLHRPEIFELTGVTRLTASIGYTGTLASHPFAALAAWGENREVHGILDAYLMEWTAGIAARGEFYGRAESVAKDLLDLGGPDPPGFTEFHRISHVAALTLGYIHDVRVNRAGRFGLGADVTVYHVPDNMLDFYGSSPRSFHVFVRWRPSAISRPHMH